jgi:CDP-paratose 2-epimerase
VGDHIWWISDISRFQRHYPGWRLTYGIKEIIEAVVEGQRTRLAV